MGNVAAKPMAFGVMFKLDAGYFVEATEDEKAVSGYESAEAIHDKYRRTMDDCYRRSGTWPAAFALNLIQTSPRIVPLWSDAEARRVIGKRGDLCSLSGEGVRGVAFKCENQEAAAELYECGEPPKLAAKGGSK